MQHTPLLDSRHAKPCLLERDLSPEIKPEFRLEYRVLILDVETPRSKFLAAKRPLFKLPMTADECVSMIDTLLGVRLTGALHVHV